MTNSLILANLRDLRGTTYQWFSPPTPMFPNKKYFLTTHKRYIRSLDMIRTVVEAGESGYTVKYSLLTRFHVHHSRTSTTPAYAKRPSYINGGP